MKTLNELTPKERLELYKKALVDWTERPYDKHAKTVWGLCFYFEYALGISARYSSDVNICSEWVENVTIKMVSKFIPVLGELGDPIPRISALNAMIKELEDAQ